MLHLKCYFQNDEKESDQNKFQLKSTFNPKNKDAAIEMYISSLEEKLMNFSMCLWSLSTKQIQQSY